MNLGARHQRRQSRDEVVWLEQYVSGAITKRTLQLKHEQPVTIKAQALLCDGTSATGGSLLPDEEFNAILAAGQKLLSR
jgi:hypothetical protein